MVKKYMFYVGQRPKYTRTKVGAFAQLDSNLIHAYVCFLSIKHVSNSIAPDYWQKENLNRLVNYLSESEENEEFTRKTTLVELIKEVSTYLKREKNIIIYKYRDGNNIKYGYK